ncbi:MAG TPA: SH3 domain-containing protein, partial [Acidobacteriota bacterium]|nr:SH3 domain-containing protein [Acidobacteriota bacterium]
MDRKAGIKILFVLFILGILMTNILSADTQKIRVVVKNSSIRLEPDVQSEIIDSPPLGAVFEVIEKMDVWYKVKLNSQKYGREEGYINIMFIEELQETEKPQQEIEKKPEVQKKDIEAEGEKIEEKKRTIESEAKKKEEEKSEKFEWEAAGTGM